MTRDVLSLSAPSFAQANCRTRSGAVKFADGGSSFPLPVTLRVCRAPTNSPGVPPPAQQGNRGVGFRGRGLLLPFEALDGVFGGRGEEVDEVAIGIAEEDGAVPPGHERWLLHPLADDGLQALVLGVDIVNHPLDDGRLVVGGAGRVVEECR